MYFDCFYQKCVLRSLCESKWKLLSLLAFHLMNSVVHKSVI